MTIDPLFWMFLAFGLIMGCFVLLYFYIERRNRETPIRSFGDLFKRSRPAKIPLSKGKISVELPPNICPVCESNVRNLKVCRKCGYEIERCKICSKIFKLDDIIVSCPFCSQRFHRNEFLEWLKIKAFCPNCRTEMDLWEFKQDKDDRIV